MSEQQVLQQTSEVATKKIQAWFVICCEGEFKGSVEHFCMSEEAAIAIVDNSSEPLCIALYDLTVVNRDGCSMFPGQYDLPTDIITHKLVRILMPPIKAKREDYEEVPAVEKKLKQ